MIKIAVIDQAQSQRALLRRCLTEFSDGNATEITIYEYKSGADFLENLWFGFHLALINHELEGSTGIEIARAIRERDKGMLIIFLSSSREFWEDGFEVQAFYYLTKPIESKKFLSVIAEAFRKINEEKRSILIITEKGLLLLDLCEIIYFKEYGDHSTNIFHRKLGKLTVDRIHSPISEIEEQIKPHGFIRPQHSCLVNPLHIKRVATKNNKKYIETSTGEEILISAQSSHDQFRQFQLICEH